MKARRLWRRPPKVFLADPAPGIAAQVGRWGAALGDPFSLSVFPTARQLLRRMEYERPDVLLLDIAFPGFDGLTALRLLQPEQTPIVLLSPDTVEGARATIQALLAGGADYLVKRGRDRHLHLAISRPRFVALLHRVRAAAASTPSDEELCEVGGVSQWLPLELDGDDLAITGPEPAPLEGNGDWFGLACAEPRHIGRIIAGFRTAPESPGGPMLLCVPQALRFGRAFRDAAARRWRRAVLDVEANDRIRAGQWRILPGRALLKSSGDPAVEPTASLVPNRMVDVRRALVRQLDFLGGRPAGSLRIFLASTPSGALLTALTDLVRKRHRVHLHPAVLAALSAVKPAQPGDDPEAYGERVA